MQRKQYVLTAFALIAILAVSTSMPAAASTTPKLVLQITVDQLRGDALTRFGDRFGTGGFRHLLDNGTHFNNAHYRHANTETAPGHATLVTGADPLRHGIIANDWIDQNTGAFVYNTEDDRQRMVRRSFHPTRSGNIHVVQDQYWLLHSTEEAKKLGVGSMAAIHGSPWAYDTYVPIIFAGPGIPHQRVSRRVGPHDIAPTLTAYLGIKPPSASIGQPLMEVFQQANEP